MFTRRPKLSYCGGGDGDLINVSTQEAKHDDSDDTDLSPSAGTQSLIRSFCEISSMRRCRAYASSCSLVMVAKMAVGRPISPAALLSVWSPQRFFFLRFLGASGSAERRGPGLAQAQQTRSDKKRWARREADSQRTGDLPRLYPPSDADSRGEQSAGGGVGVSLAPSAPPNRRRVPSGMLLVPVIPPAR